MTEQADLFGGQCKGKGSTPCDAMDGGLRCLCALSVNHRYDCRCANCKGLFNPAPQDRVHFKREEEIRDRTLAHLATLRKQYLEEIRPAMRTLLAQRRSEWGERAFVTSDDARTYFEALPHVPVPAILNRNFLGSVFKVDGWRAVGMRNSRTKGRHANRVFKWVHE